ncbi:MAG: phosphoribosylanthranilate isomerase [Armatimonadetes bacterium]|nr:phosphoribosylanthranilate isomerase [Armatimonadota bacterium]
MNGTTPRVAGATRVKFCGFRSADAVAAAVAAGADAVGFNFHAPSARSVSLAQAAELAAGVPLWVDRVALLVSADEARIRAAAEAVNTRTVQLHGDVPVELLRRLGDLRVILAVPAAPGETLARVAERLPYVAALLLDAAVPGQHGGTGQVADWAEAATVRDTLGHIPLLLAGGLTEHNVVQAIERVRPYAVDVASGVESSPGVKDAGLMAAFASVVRRME